MPAYSDLTSALDRQLLLQLGERLKRTRLSRGLSTVELAKRVGISRTTLTAVEAGDPTPTMGTYLRVMSALGIAGDLALVASEALVAEPRDTRPMPRKRVARPAQPVVAVSDAQHEAQDLQSLMLHKEAIRLMQDRPDLIQQALATLDKWRASGANHSRALWDEWAVILHRKAWRKALAGTRRARELRQASPLPTILPPDVRKDVLDQIRELKGGVKLGPESRTPARSDVDGAIP